MRPASPCSPGNRRPPCDQPHLADPAITVRHATSPPRRPGNRRPPVMPPFSIQAQPLPHGAGGPHAKRTVVSRPRRPSTAKRGRGDSRKGPQLAGVAEGRGAIGSARSRIRQGCGWQGPLPENLRVTGRSWQGPQPESRRVTGHSRKGPQLAGGGCNRKCPQPHPAGLRVAGSAAGKPASDRAQLAGAAVGRGRRGEGLRKRGAQSEGPQPHPAGTCGESGGVFSRALYHLQA